MYILPNRLIYFDLNKQSNNAMDVQVIKQTPPSLIIF